MLLVFVFQKLVLQRNLFIAQAQYVEHKTYGFLQNNLKFHILDLEWQLGVFIL